MADTGVQREVAEWIIDRFLPAQFGGVAFRRREVRLQSGGLHQFAAVSEDGRRVGSICTGRARTARAKLAVGKMNKIRADMFFLLTAQCDERFLVFTDREMFDLMQREKNEFRRVPKEIELLFAALPEELRERLDRSQARASEEVTPT